MARDLPSPDVVSLLRIISHIHASPAASTRSEKVRVGVAKKLAGAGEEAYTARVTWEGVVAAYDQEEGFQLTVDMDLNGRNSIRTRKKAILCKW